EGDAEVERLVHHLARSLEIDAPAEIVAPEPHQRDTQARAAEIADLHLSFLDLASEITDSCRIPARRPAGTHQAAVAGERVKGAVVLGFEREIEDRDILACMALARGLRDRQYARLLHEPAQSDLVGGPAVLFRYALHHRLVHELAAGERAVGGDRDAVRSRVCDDGPLREQEVILDLIADHRALQALDRLAQVRDGEIAHAESADLARGLQPLHG